MTDKPPYKISEGPSEQEKLVIFFSKVKTAVVKPIDYVALAKVDVFFSEEAFADNAPDAKLTGVFVEGALHHFIEGTFNELYSDYQQAIVDFFKTSFDGRRG